jgi:hypothetical protein
LFRALSFLHGWFWVGGVSAGVCGWLGLGAALLVVFLFFLGVRFVLASGWGCFCFFLVLACCVCCVFLGCFL